MEIKNKKFIVTGGAGFIGSNLVDRLVDLGCSVHVIDDFSTGLRENCNKEAIYHEKDISDINLKKTFDDIMNDADGIFHMAARARVQPSIEDPINSEKNNTQGTINMLTSAKDSNVKRFVYSSSSSVYGDPVSLPTNESSPINPLSPYGMQKYYGELACNVFAKIFSIETVSLRYFNVYGEKQNFNGAYSLVMSIFANQLKNRQPLSITGDGEQKRDFTYVGDVVNANILAMESEFVGKGESINIGNGSNYSINQIADMMGGKKVYIDPVIEPKETLADNFKAQQILNWKPSMDLKEWIKTYKKDLGI